MNKRIIVMMVLLVAAFGTSLNAQTTRNQEIEQLKKQLTQLQKRLEQLESNQQRQTQTMENKISEIVEQKQVDALPESIKWVEGLNIGGDFRYRYETTEAENDNNRDRHRNRIRARLNINAKINEELDFGLRLATGSGSPTSTNQTLDEAFSNKDFRLDRAYIDWHPLSVEGLNVYMGKMPFPLYKAGDNELIWDGDLSPEGIATNYVIPVSETHNLHLNGGGFWAEESSSGVDQGLFAGQAYLKHALANNSSLAYGASLYCYGNLSGEPTLYDDEDSYGNTARSVDVDSDGTNETFYTMDYDLFELFGEYQFDIANTPMSFYGNWVRNIVADGSADTGWLVGMTLNDAAKPGDWEFSYNYRELQSNAVLGVFSDSDFIGGGTNGRGHEFGLKYKLAEHIDSGLTYFLDERGDNDNNYRRLQADLKFKF